MRSTSLIISAAAGLTLAQAAQADPLFYDPFNYPASPNPTSLSINHDNNGAEQDELANNFPEAAGQPIPNWIDYYGAGEGPYVGSGNLTYPGLLNLNPTSNTAAYHGIANSVSDAYHWFGQPATWDGSGGTSGEGTPFTTYPINPSSSTTLYYSALLHVNQVGSSTGVTVKGGNGNTYSSTSDGWTTTSTPKTQLMMGFMDQTKYSGTGAQTAIGDTAGALLIESGDGTQYGTTYKLGIGGTSTTTGYYPTSGTTYQAGVNGPTLFVVVAYTMNPTVGSNVAQLYINPTPGTLQSANAVAVQTPTGLTEPGNLTGFLLKETGALPDYGLEVDELRIGASWGDVAAWATPGDANDDGTVNTADFDIIAANYGQTSGVNWNSGDFNNDGTVNALDFNAMATNWGDSVTDSQPAAALGAIVPEPSAALLLLSGASILLTTHRRRKAAR